jgi:hypothetical protein
MPEYNPIDDLFRKDQELGRQLEKMEERLAARIEQNSERLGKIENEQSRQSSAQDGVNQSLHNWMERQQKIVERVTSVIWGDADRDGLLAWKNGVDRRYKEDREEMEKKSREAKELIEKKEKDLKERYDRRHHIIVSLLLILVSTVLGVVAKMVMG